MISSNYLVTRHIYLFEVWFGSLVIPCSKQLLIKPLALIFTHFPVSCLNDLKRTSLTPTKVDSKKINKENPFRTFCLYFALFFHYESN